MVHTVAPSASVNDFQISVFKAAGGQAVHSYLVETVIVDAVSTSMIDASACLILSLRFVLIKIYNYSLEKVKTK